MTWSGELRSLSDLIICFVNIYRSLQKKNINEPRAGIQKMRKERIDIDYHELYAHGEEKQMEIQVDS